MSVENDGVSGMVAGMTGDSTSAAARTGGASRPAIDALSPASAISAMLRCHAEAVAVVGMAAAAIDAAARIVAASIERGGTVHYAGAGSSGLMALADACELSGTFGIPAGQVRIAMAGGIPRGAAMPGDTEDDAESGARAAASVVAGDVAVVLSASGTTPFALAFADTARRRGTSVIGIANVSDAPLLTGADLAIALPTGPEVVEGSTRLGAGTAQKVALNAMSTRVGIRLGHVREGLMVNLRADNAKLRRRARDIVMRLAGADAAAATAALARTGQDVKLACLVASGVEIGAARMRLARNGGRLRDDPRRVGAGAR